MDANNLPRLTSINRSLLVVRPKQPYQDYCGFGPEYNWSSDFFTVLVPDLQNAHECIAYLARHQRFEAVFRELLEDAPKDRGPWPDTSSFAVFQAWFALEYHGIVLDCADDYLPLGTARLDLYYREGRPNWYIGSNGMLSDAEWEHLAQHPNFAAFASGFSNQWDLEKAYRARVLEHGDVSDASDCKTPKK